MRGRPLFAPAFLSLLLLANFSAAQDGPAQVPGDEFVVRALRPFWKTREQTETLFFVQLDPMQPPQATLLFPAEKIHAVTSATRADAYQAGQDYEYDAKTGTLRALPGSAIRVHTFDDLYPLLTSKTPKIGKKKDDPTRGIFWGEGALYHSHQVEVQYTAAEDWKGTIPQFAGGQLPRALQKLRQKAPLKVLLSGDSISEGYNATKFTRAQPGCPTYGELVARGLQRAYGSEVAFENVAHAGWRSERGLKQAREEKLGQKHPDLVLIAFGMNDVGSRNARAYQKNVRELIETIRADAPDAEFILVASMLGNAEWGMPQEQFPLYRDALRELCGPGVALADLTTLWQELLRRKSFYDLTGNGVNHPNDWGHLLYAQTILSLLVESSGESGS